MITGALRMLLSMWHHSAGRDQDLLDHRSARLPTLSVPQHS